jgi:hypothetical protein
MTPTEVLGQIRQMSLNDIREVAEQLTEYLRDKERTALATQEAEAREDEFERYLLAKGVINQIPSRDETDEDFDTFEPIKIDGEPLSETVIRERR